MVTILTSFSVFQFSHTFAFLKQVISAHSLSKLLQYLLNKQATSAELCSLNHEAVQSLLSVCANISHSLKVDDEFRAGKVICTVLARSLTQLDGPRRNDLTL
jgi:hypothetical protein